MYDENGWLPKWELNSTETFTMVGDPASIVIADTYLKGIKDFDVQKQHTKRCLKVPIKLRIIHCVLN
jgi:putative alpha-1,2-mannosidase